MRERVEQALRELPLSEPDIAATTVHLCRFNLLFRDHLPRNSDSSFFDFRRKVTEVVTHFNGAGLTLPDYLDAAVKQPQLFCQSPATLIGNIEGAAEHFREHGLTLPNYLGAAIKQPQLFCHSPATLIDNIEGVVEHFHAHGALHINSLK